MAKSKGNAASESSVKDLPSTLHPPYFQMIAEAIMALKDRTGSSQPAIAKFMEEKYSNVLPPNFKKVLSIQLKKFVKSERLVKIKSLFKMSEDEKLKLSVKEGQNGEKTKTKKKEKAATKKTKRLSQVKTPEALKKAKTKRLSQVKTSPVEAKKKKKKNLSPVKRKARK